MPSPPIRRVLPLATAFGAAACVWQPLPPSGPDSRDTGTACEPRTWHIDADADGYGDSDDHGTEACSAPAGAVDNRLDCDDADPLAYPGAPELCDGRQNDCSDEDWSEDLGVATRISSGAEPEPIDVTADFAAGFETAPVSLSLEADSVYRLCPGTWFLELLLHGDQITIEGVADAPTQVVISGGGLIRPLTHTSGSATVRNLTIRDGRADTGGGVHTSSSGELGLSEVIVRDNEATSAGGVHVGRGATLTLDESTVTANSDTDVAGGIHVDQGTLVVGGGAVSDNTSTTGAGGVYLTDATASFTDTAVTGNSTLAQSGGLHIDADSTANLAGGSLSENTASGAAAAMVLGDLTLSGATVHGNVSTGSEETGAFRVAGGATLEATDTDFTANLSAETGPALLETLESEVPPTVSITGGSIVGNTAGVEGGGAIRMADGELTLTEVEVTDNEGKNGGVINMTGGELTVDRCRVTDNHAQSAGGFLHQSGGDVLLLDSTFERNSCDFAGGAVSATSSADTIEVLGCTFEENVSTSRGGALRSSAELTVEDSTFRDNTAPSGGALYLGESGTTSVSGTTFDDNIATEGGALYLPEFFSGTASFSSSTFSGSEPDTVSAGGESLDFEGAEVSFTCQATLCVLD